MKSVLNIIIYQYKLLFIDLDRKISLSKFLGFRYRQCDNTIFHAIKILQLSGSGPILLECRQKLFPLTDFRQPLQQSAYGRR